MIKEHYAFNKHTVAYVAPYLFCSLMWAILFLAPLFCVAQEVDSLKKVNQLNDISIYEYKLSIQSKSLTPVQILNANDLKRLNSLSVADALRYFSGLQIKDYGGIGGLKTVNVRSMGSNHTAVFLDGVQVGNAQNGQVDLGRFSLDNIEEIKLFSGQNPELLLPARAFGSASAVYLKTKQPVFADNETKTANVSLKLGSFGLINPSILFQKKISENLSASINTEITSANGQYKFRSTNGVYDTVAVRSNGDVERFRLQAGLYGKLKNEGNWQLQTYAYSSRRGLPGAVVANRFDYPQRFWDRNFFIQGSFEQPLNSKFTFLINAKYALDYTRFLDPEYISINGFLDNKFKEQERYLSASLKYTYSKHLEIAYASDFTNQTLDANLYRFAYPNRTTYLNVLSALLKYNRVNLQANVLSTTVNERVKIYDAGGNRQIFSPTILLSYKLLPNEDLRLRAFYKDIFRMPTFNDLYYTFIGYSLLKPEFTKQYNLGLTYFKSFQNSSIQFIDLQADAYYNEVTDKIIAQPGANLARWIMYNLGKVDIRGLEVNLKTAFKVYKELALNFGLNYTYQKAVDISSKTEDNYKDQIPYIPKNSGSFFSKVDYKNWHANYSFIYTGFRYNQKANIVYNYMEPWYTHDLAFGRDFYIDKKPFSVNIEVNNLLNQYYDVIPNFPLPGRNYRLTLNYKI